MLVGNIIISTFLMLIFYCLSLLLLDWQLKFGGVGEGRMNALQVICITGSVMALGWFIFYLVCESIELPRQLLVMSMLSMLAVLTVTDCLKRKIPNSFLFFFLIFWVLVTSIHMILDAGSGRDLLFSSLKGTIVGGGIFFLCYMISRRCLGAGDVKLVLVLGLYLTEKKIMGTIFCSMVLCCIYFFIQMARKKLVRKDSLPMVPFLFAGTLITLLF